MAAVDSFEFLYREICLTCGFYRDTLALLGAVYAASQGVRLLRVCCSSVRVHLLPRWVPGRSLRQRYGAWAVVYGASGPIASAYTEELARQGISIAFVAHDPSSVADLAASLSQRYHVQTTVLLVPFSLEPGTSKPIKDGLRDKDVGILVNCVDESLLSPRSLMSTEEQELLGTVTKNVGLSTLMTHLVLPGMVERGRGAVVNISSSGGRRPQHGRAMLAACTGYLDCLSRALRHEYENRGIFVQSLRPSHVALSGGGLFVLRPDVFAVHAVSTLGVSYRTSGHWLHALQCELLRWIPDWMWLLTPS